MEKPCARGVVLALLLAISLGGCGVDRVHVAAEASIFGAIPFIGMILEDVGDAPISLEVDVTRSPDVVRGCL